MDREIREFYGRGYEDERLRVGGDGRLEFLRTQEIVRRFVGEPGRVLDVGGATGVHAGWLAEDGHDVVVVDAMPSHVEVAGALPGVSAVVGDARDLPVDGPFDAVLLFGPLYHLVEREDRLRAWREALRVVRPGGVVLGAVIGRFAPLLDGLRKDFVLDPRYRDLVTHGLRTGQHRPPPDTSWFTTAYLHRPEEAAAEAREAGLDVVGTFAVEGVAWLRSNADLDAAYADPELVDYLMWSLREVEQEESVLGASSHLITVARRG
ncbi:ubiquinone/menaquinone biosynthesis C-methylase UbiE [Saccharothrix carnea]|uniref:Ubiquinone/menaquinone biosynthesis C-methylase UbiE n=1 Tax=Saccharothrix carnea TaxID=1280637 RepID=A0A2P8I9P0_SACCR|nr:class I SAM-dependent methyltransferase [Saccharothrix carnea]PSL55193.1 ubiquinone/menaquinone biosynthesis C-methylase UbiE [Saccharothrix carnea]